MSNRTPLAISILLVALMAAAGYWAWIQLPPHAEIAVHWGINGAPNGFANRTRALFMMPAIAALATVLFAAIPSIEPRRPNLIASRKLYRAGWLGALFVMTVAQAAIVMTALQRPFDIHSAVVGATSLLYIVAGNYLGKSRANFFVGIRTPWTLSSDYSWEKTHRLGGRLFVATGIATLLVLAANGATDALFLQLGALAASIVAMVAMSYVYWKRDPEKNGAPAMAE
jgi:uncharacterized membrane protein